jgi:hypothetical protein
MTPDDMKIAQKNQLVVKEVDYQLIIGNLYKLGIDGVLRCCVLEYERPVILVEAHNGIAKIHYAGNAKAQNILCVVLWCPTLHNETK